MSEIKMSPAVGYLRVSTPEQGRSGLGLAAQRHEIEAFGAREGFAVKSWYQDVQTGWGADALLLRPGLAAALKEAKTGKCPLIVSKLDRLSRNVYFISGLMEHRVHFIVAALGRDVPNVHLHMHASFAEHERQMISDRIKAAFARSKKKQGFQRPGMRSKAVRRRIQALGRAALRKGAMERAQAYRVYVEWALGQRGEDGRPISVSGAARKLNEQHVASPRGGHWEYSNLSKMAQRLGLYTPPVPAPYEITKARVLAIWKEYPDYAPAQIVRCLGPEPPIHKTRVYRILKPYWLARARRCPVYKKMGWPVDRLTVARVHIFAVWRRHPEFTAKQVVRRLRAKHSLSMWTVERLMRQCWRASARHSAKKVLIGRRCFGSWRAWHAAGADRKRAEHGPYRRARLGEQC